MTDFPLSYTFIDDYRMVFPCNVGKCTVYAAMNIVSTFDYKFEI